MPSFFPFIVRWTSSFLQCLKKWGGWSVSVGLGYRLRSNFCLTHSPKYSHKHFNPFMMLFGHSEHRITRYMTAWTHLTLEQFLKIRFHRLLSYLSKMRGAMTNSLVLRIWCFWVWHGVGVGVGEWVCFAKGCIPIALWCWRDPCSFQRLHLTHFKYTQMNGITCNILMEQWERLFETGFCIFL